MLFRIYPHKWSIFSSNTTHARLSFVLSKRQLHLWLGYSFDKMTKQKTFPHIWIGSCRHSVEQSKLSCLQILICLHFLKLFPLLGMWSDLVWKILSIRLFLLMWLLSPHWSQFQQYSTRHSDSVRVGNLQHCIIIRIGIVDLQMVPHLCYTMSEMYLSSRGLWSQSGNWTKATSMSASHKEVGNSIGGTSHLLEVQKHIHRTRCMSLLDEVTCY